MVIYFLIGSVVGAIYYTDLSVNPRKDEKKDAQMSRERLLSSSLPPETQFFMIVVIGMSFWPFLAYALIKTKAWRHWRD
jgi:hypothetical protein